MKREKAKGIIATFVLFAIITILLVVFLPTLKNRNMTGKSGAFNELPKINITLNDVDLETIEDDKTKKYAGNKVVISDSDDIAEYDDVEIKGHGNSTWENDKKSYRLKFTKKVSLFGAASVKKWVLLSNNFDATQLRNNIAFYLGKMLNMDYTVEGHYVELTIDDSYRGLYLAVPKIEISKDVVNLHSDFSVLVELDNLHGTEKGCYYSGEGMCFVVSDMVNKENEKVVMDEFIEGFNKFEKATREGDYNSIKDVIDVESFAKYFILSEFTINPDAYTTSWYMYKDALDDKIHVGPGWDYDFAFGNHNWIWNSNEDFYSPELDMVRETDAIGGKVFSNGEFVEKEPDYSISRVIIRLMKMPQFKNKVEDIFKKLLSGRKTELLSYARTQVNRIGSAILRDNDRWGRDSSESEIDYLLTWVGKRYDHFEKTYGGKDTK